MDSATADGALTTVVSVKPARFKRLQLVAEQLTRNAQHVAGLNPKAFRYVIFNRVWLRATTIRSIFELCRQEGCGDH